MPEAYAGVEYNYIVQAEDMYKKNIPDIDIHINLQESNFKEIIFNTQTHNLKIIPTYEELGTQYVSLTLKDNYENSINENFPIKVLSSPCETSDTLYIDEEEVIKEPPPTTIALIFLSVYNQPVMIDLPDDVGASTIVLFLSLILLII